jgi:multicomponent Na+:H+ antiporter subunit B
VSSDRQPLRGPTDFETQEPLHRPRIGLLVAVAFAVCLGVGLVTLPRETAPLPAIARHALVVAIPHWKITEPVNEVVYGTRGVDTFGETFLLLAAVSSVILFTRGREGRRGFVGETRAGDEEQREEDPDEGLDAAERAARKAETAEWIPAEQERLPTPDDEALGAPAPETAETMSVVVRGVVRAFTPALALAGVYLVAQGFSPGGGFPGGAVMVGVLLFAYAGLGYRRLATATSNRLVEVIELAGAFALVALETLGLILAGSFSANWLPLGPLETLRSGGVVQAFSVIEFVEVGAGLTLAIFALMRMQHDWSPDPGGDSGDEEVSQP